MDDLKQKKSHEQVMQDDLKNIHATPPSSCCEKLYNHEKTVENVKIPSIYGGKLDTKSKQAICNKSRSALY